MLAVPDQQPRSQEEEFVSARNPIAESSVDASPIRIPESDLEDLRSRLERTRWSDELPGAESDYGVPISYVRRLVEHWLTRYDWRKWEARLNQCGPSETAIDGQHVHFLHVRSREPDAFPLIMTHGWPGSIVEFLDVIAPLTDPRAHGGKAADAFHVVVPALPGYGFSGPTRERGWHNTRIAAAWAALMARLGYDRYGAVGNDAGSMISPEIGRIDPDHVTGVHVTQLFSFPSGDPNELKDLTADEMAQLQILQWFYQNKFSFNVLMAQQPQTLGYAIDDSPVGLLAWLAQLLGEELDPDFVVTNVMMYWLTRTGSSSARLYYENAHAARPSEPTTLPTGLAGFGGDFYGIRRLAERDHKGIVRCTTHDHGGHFAAHKVPELYVADVRAFFREIGR
jgi:pimeloyl-ACP methyl ester carboxylesterase